MKTIEVDDELYSYIASHTKHIGESASDILRRMLKFSATTQPTAFSGEGDACGATRCRSETG
ncbi:replication initiation regulator SeqA [Salmonella enterica subsp. enterica]|uniref:Replication initiation regulator SeqA n=1 Tax=Salmonella enterica I TaxID=59201 RepID=A0A3S4I6I6_SALET|nr:replication initiation regulator SeqA [Salmonella enterica subsp. enterica]